LQAAAHVLTAQAGTSFCEQKEAKKLQFSVGRGSALPTPPNLAEVFWFFFQKRTACLTTANASPDTSRPTATAAPIMRRV
jgi:hypothetical protein